MNERRWRSVPGRRRRRVGEPGTSMPSFAAALTAFAVLIAAGYFAGRVGVISVKGEGPRALGAFIGRFSLPALLFKELATLSFGSIDVHLLIAITVGKAGVFFGVLLLDAPRRASAWGRRCGSSRCRRCGHLLHAEQRLRLGLPVMTALYRESSPSMVSMLYLLSLCRRGPEPDRLLLMGAAEGDGAEGRGNRRRAGGGGGGGAGRSAIAVLTPSADAAVSCTMAGAAFNAVLGPRAAVARHVVSADLGGRLHALRALLHGPPSGRSGSSTRRRSCPASCAASRRRAPSPSTSSSASRGSAQLGLLGLRRDPTAPSCSSTRRVPRA